MRVVGWIREAEAMAALTLASEAIGAELASLDASPRANRRRLVEELRAEPDLVVAEFEKGAWFEELRAETRRRGIALVALCRSGGDAVDAARFDVDECVLPPLDVGVLATRLRVAEARGAHGRYPRGGTRAADYLRYEELLHDRCTGFPTLPVVMERGRRMLERAGRLTILYLQFVRYARLEEVYGWEKLDDVLRTSANALREFIRLESGGSDNVVTISHVADEDFVVLTTFRNDNDDADKRLNDLAGRFEKLLRERVEAAHGAELATLVSTYVGASTVYRDPKIRTERTIHRGVREAAQAASGLEARERRRRIADLRMTLREGAVHIEYQPILLTTTGEIYGYEALARGSRRGLRSPEILFDVARDANLVWELSRLCRRRAVEGAASILEPGQLLFLNVDPYDFRDPSFRFLDVEGVWVPEPDRIVLEITERIAITDYVAFQGYLRNFRERGFRFAVDDAGSGYAGLGSIANLEPDYIKLDISLISGIDGNFMKQNLVETMVDFAEDHSIKVIAEGIERQEEFEAVKRLGVHLAQGYLFHGPEYVRKPAAAGA